LRSCPALPIFAFCKFCPFQGAKRKKDRDMERRTRLLNVGEAAAYLGVSAASLRNWSNQGLVPVFRTPGGQRRYSTDDLDEFIRSMRQPTVGAAAAGG
jgi:excisionase family DNA binding protein